MSTPSWGQQDQPQQPGQQWDGPQPGWGQQPPPAGPGGPKKSGKAKAGCLGCLGVVGLVVVIGVVASIASGGKDSVSSGSSSKPTASSSVKAAGTPASKAAPKKKAADTVTYVVTGSTADVTYGPAGSNASHSVPMRVTKPLGNPQYVSITAQLQGSGKVQCELLVNGKVISKATASGGYNIASCEISKDPFSGKWKDTNAG